MSSEREVRDRRLIAAAARAAVKKANADPMLLGALAARLRVYNDPRLGEGAAALLVLDKNDPKNNPERVLEGMREEPEYADYFAGSPATRATLEGEPEEYELETQRLIEAAIKRIAPDENPLLVQPMKKLQIAREIREQRGGLSLRETAQKRTPTPAPSTTAGSEGGGSAIDRLKEARRSAAT